MNYANTVEKVMSLLKEKKVCSSSRKSHRDCYESLSFCSAAMVFRIVSHAAEFWISIENPEKIKRIAGVEAEVQLERLLSASTAAISEKSTATTSCCSGQEETGLSGISQAMLRNFRM